MASFPNPLPSANPSYVAGASGSNQYASPTPTMNMPGNTAMPTGGPSMYPNPYQVPSQGAPVPAPAGQRWDPSNPSAASSSGNLGHGIIATGLQYPGLSQDWANYLMSQIGQGMTPFNLQTMLPSGGETQAGQLTAGLNPMLQQLMQFFLSGNTGQIPGLSSLADIANKGVSALPAWQSMVGAQQQNIAQQEANLREQFGFAGNLAGTPFGTSMANFTEQTARDQNALLGQLQLQGILQGQLPAAEQLFQGATQFGSGLQQLDQSAIDRMYQEFQRVSPQNNPMLQYISQLSQLYPPTTKTPTAAESAMQWISTLSGAFGNAAGGMKNLGITF